MSDKPEYFNGGIWGEYELTAENLDKWIKFQKYIDRERIRMGLYQHYTPVFNNNNEIEYWKSRISAHKIKHIK